MSDWKSVRLEELAAPVKSAMATGPFGSAVSSKNFRPSGVPMLRGSNLSDDVGIRLIESNLVYLEPELAETFSRSTARAGDLIFTCWGTVGQIGLIDDSSKHDHYIVSNKQMKLTLDQTKTDPRFLYYYLSQPTMLELVKGQAIGSTIPGFNLGQLRALPVRVPDRPTQQAIAEVLEALDDKIAVNDKLINVADALGASLARRALDSSASQPLSSIAVITMGTSPAGTSFNEEGRGSVFYQGVRDFGVRFPTRRVWTESPVRFAKATDCLLSVRAPVGQVNLATEETCIGRGLASVRSRNGRPNTLFHLLRNAPEIWAPYESEGTIFGSINKSQLDLVQVPTVVSSRAAQLEVQLASIEARIASALGENEMLGATRNAFLPQLMSGKLRVRDAEEVLEGVR